VTIMRSVGALQQTLDGLTAQSNKSIKSGKV